MHKLSSFFYARPSIMEEIARIIDFGNTLQQYNTGLTAEQSDYLALSADWQVIGDDFKKVIPYYDCEELDLD